MCNIYERKCNPKIPEGYYKCFHCKGNGCFLINSHFKQKVIDIELCPTCMGKGFVDWITFLRKSRSGRSFYSQERSFYCSRDKSCKVIKRWIKNIERRKDEIPSLRNYKK